MPLALRGKNGELRFTRDTAGTGGWCHVVLIADGIERPLGAERQKYITDQFLRFFSETSIDVRWILSLSELHSSLYGCDSGEDVIIHIQDANGSSVCKLVLSQVEKASWIQELLHSTE
jgi:hypothetical protein